MDPVTVMAALGLLSTGAQYLQNKENDKYRRKLERDQQQSNRRSAIERAMGGSSINRIEQPRVAPDTSNYALVSGLANLGSGLAAGKYL